MSDVPNPFDPKNLEPIRMAKSSARMIIRPLVLGPMVTALVISAYQIKPLWAVLIGFLIGFCCHASLMIGFVREGLRLEWPEEKSRDS